MQIALGCDRAYAAGRVVYAPPEFAPAQFVETIKGAVRKHRVDLVIPVTDPAILRIAEARSDFEGLCALSIPSIAALETARNKQSTIELAERLGVPVPRTVVVAGADEAVAAARNFSWPVVLKPRVSRLHNGALIEKLLVSYAENVEALTEAMRRFEGRCPVLLQEFCPGEGQGVELLMHEGRPLAAFQHRRLREMPVQGGPSALRESVSLDPVLYEHSVNMLREIRWTGLAMVEFKVSPEAAWLMEINGRVWGSLPLAVHAGMDFPARLVELLLLRGRRTRFRPVLELSDWRALAQLGTRARLDRVGPVEATPVSVPPLSSPSPVHGRAFATISPGLQARHAFARGSDAGTDRYPENPEARCFAICPAAPSNRAMLAILKLVAQNAADTALASRFASFLERIHPAGDNQLQVLTYHRIDEPQSNPDLTPSTLSATPAMFRRQMEHLSAHYRVVSLAEVIAAHRGKVRLPPRAVLITFDDAYQDFAEHAWPVLRRLGLPATLFVPTAYPDHPERTFWWDRVYHAVAQGEARRRSRLPWGIADLSTRSGKQRAYKHTIAWLKSMPHDAAMHCVEEIAAQLQAPLLGRTSFRGMRFVVYPPKVLPSARTRKRIHSSAASSQKKPLPKPPVPFPTSAARFQKLGPSSPTPAASSTPPPLKPSAQPASSSPSPPAAGSTISTISIPAGSAATTSAQAPPAPSFSSASSPRQDT